MSNESDNKTIWHKLFSAYQKTIKPILSPEKSKNIELRCEQGESKMDNRTEKLNVPAKKRRSRKKDLKESEHLVDIETKEDDSDIIIFGDTETTGLKDPKICSIALIKANNNGKEIARFVAKFNPERELEPGATLTNGFTWEDLKGEPLFKTKAQEILDFVGNARVVFHNAKFDMGVLQREMADCGKSIQWKVIDTFAMFCDITNNCGASLECPHNLEYMAECYGVKNLRGDTHGAEVDAQMLMLSYDKLNNDFQYAIKQPKFLRYQDLVEKLLDLDGDFIVNDASCCTQKQYDAYVNYKKKFKNTSAYRVWSPMKESYSGKVWLNPNDKYDELFKNVVKLHTPNGDKVFLISSLNDWEFKKHEKTQNDQSDVVE